MSSPIYILAGKDQALRDQARARLLAELIGDADPQTCLAQYDGDVELAVVFDELRTMPFLAPPLPSHVLCFFSYICPSPLSS